MKKRQSSTSKSTQDPPEETSIAGESLKPDFKIEPPPQILPIPSFDTSLTPRELQEKERYARREERAGGGVRRGPDELKPASGDRDVAGSSQESTGGVDMSSEGGMANSTGS